jgi:CRISPR-associated protein Cmr5
MSNRQTREQQRAAQAFENVRRVPAQDGDVYTSLARGLSAMIQSNGLGQTLAFLLAKDEGKRAKPHYLLYQHVSRWVSRQMEGQETDLLEWIVDKNSDAYRRARAEALAFAVWLARFAEAQVWAQAGTRGGSDEVPA